MLLKRREFLLSAAAMASASATPVFAQARKPLPVVATFSVLGDMLSQIGGDRIGLTTLVGPNGDAHVYQPTPAAARAVASAKLLASNGVSFDGWLERLIEAAEFQGRHVVATTGVELIEFEDEHEEGHDDHDDHADEGRKDHDDHDDHAEEGHKDHDDHDDHADEGHKDHDDHDDHAEEGHKDHDDHAGHHHHDHGDEDPHAWHDLSKGAVYARNIAEGLAAADPEGAKFYTDAADAYIAKMNALHAEILEMMGAIPAERRVVVTPHDAFGYFGKAYGIEFLAPQGFSTESEASAADVARLITQIKDQGVSAVFVENVSDKRLIEQIARETGAKIGGTLYSDALSGPEGPAGTYLNMMRHNATTIAGAISG